MSNVAIKSVPHELLVQMAPFIGPHLARGLPGSGREAVDIARDIHRQHNQVWAIFLDGEVVGAFLTAIVVEDDGSRYLDVFGLGGERILAWGRELADQMVAFARANDCSRVVFAGRKALQRAYGGLTVIGQKGDNTFIYERAA